MKNNHLFLFVILLLCFGNTQLKSQEITSSINLITDPTENIEWSFKTEASIYASPIIFDETIYIGSLDSNFYAIDANTGKEIWHFKTAQSISANAALANDYILFESGNILYALNAEGKEQWRFKLFSDTAKFMQDPWDFHRSTPTIHNGVAYVGTEMGLLYGIDIMTGIKVFEIQTTHKNLIRSTPLIENYMLYFGDWQGVMYAYDLKSKKLAWEYDTRKDEKYWINSIIEKPTIYNGAVYFTGRSCRLYALDAETGKMKWVYKSPIDSWLCSSPVIYAQQLYIGSSDSHKILSFNPVTGELIWETELDCRVWGNALVDGTEVYIGSNSFYLLNKNNGNITTQIKFEPVHEPIDYGGYIDKKANIHSSAIKYNNDIIFGSDDGNVYSISFIE